MTLKHFLIGAFLTATCFLAVAQEAPFGLTADLSNLYRLSTARTFSISPENLNGAKGRGGTALEGGASNAARDLGQGWKVNPFVVIKSKQTLDRKSTRLN